MNYAYLFAGLFIGSLAPWILMLGILRKKDKQVQEGHLKPNVLLAERNEIGLRQARALENIAFSLGQLAVVSSTPRERSATMGAMLVAAHQLEDIAETDAKTIAVRAVEIGNSLIAELDGEEEE